MLLGPASGRQIAPLRDAELQIGRTMLLGIRQLAQHIGEIIITDKMMPLRMTHDTQKLHSSWCTLWMTQEEPVACGAKRLLGSGQRALAVPRCAAFFLAA